MDLIEFEEKKEKAVLVCVDMGLYDAESSLDELEELARTAGAEVAARVTQKRDKPDSAYYIGTGRLDELKAFCEETDRCFYLNAFDYEPLARKDILVEDHVHFNQQGYDIYADFFREAIKSELDQY